ncbi:MAG TPA: methionyl-tRNA formyltransferase, partial [Sedimentibacter sp.]|nr:methionyl-tRNA formyltransferase [Sedimentibacter sp.]
LEKNELSPQKQDDSLSSYAPMINKEDRKIKWKLTAKDIHNLIRGLSPWPTAYFTMDEDIVKVYKASYINDDSDYQPGYVIKANKEGIFVKAGEGAVILKEIQMPGKNKMPVEAFLRGNKFPEKIMLE